LYAVGCTGKEILVPSERPYERTNRQQNCPNEEEQQNTSFSDTYYSYSEKDGDGTHYKSGALEAKVTL
jgi:hypothetical protein